MQNLNLKELWSELQFELANTNLKNNEYTRDIRQQLLELKESQEDYDPKRTYHIDEGVSKYALDVSDYTRQPITINGEERDAGSGVELNDITILRLGVAWRSKQSFDIDIFCCAEFAPGEPVTHTDPLLLKDGVLMGVVSGDVLGSGPEQYSIEVIDIDVKLIASKFDSLGYAGINIGFNINEPQSNSVIKKEDLEVAFFLECLCGDDHQLAREDSGIIQLPRPLPLEGDTFYLNDILSPTTLVASLHVNNMLVALPNQPLRQAELAKLITDGHPRNIPNPSKNPIDIKNMLETVIRPENITSDPETADIIITDKVKPTTDNKVINPEYDMRKIKDLLML